MDPDRAPVSATRSQTTDDLATLFAVPERDALFAVPERGQRGLGAQTYQVNAANRRRPWSAPARKAGPRRGWPSLPRRRPGPAQRPSHRALPTHPTSRGAAPGGRPEPLNPAGAGVTRLRGTGSPAPAGSYRARGQFISGVP
jgi:hypothetical protein